AMWAVTAPGLVVSAFYLSFWVWALAALVGFLVPELIGINKDDDSLPPLTHAIRHFLPNWAAFPLIYFALGSVGAHWLSYGEPLRLGVIMALLGWLTDHFIRTYDARDPYPHDAIRRGEAPSRLLL